MELGEIVVEPTPNGGKATRVVEPSKEEEPAEDADEDDDEERFCRICLEPVSLDSIRDGKSLRLGCACKSGYMHKACAWEYVQVKKTKPVTCEVCLEDMTALDPIAELQGEEYRAMRRARAALLRVNGEDDHDPREDPTFDDADPRGARLCWGSRNPVVWLIWLVSRPVVAVVWVSLPDRHPSPRSILFRGEYRADTALAAFEPASSLSQLWNCIPVALAHWCFILSILTFWAAVLWTMYDTYDSSLYTTG